MILRTWSGGQTPGSGIDVHFGFIESRLLFQTQSYKAKSMKWLTCMTRLRNFAGLRNGPMLYVNLEVIGMSANNIMFCSHTFLNATRSIKVIEIDSSKITHYTRRSTMQMSLKWKTMLVCPSSITFPSSPKRLRTLKPVSTKLGSAKQLRVLWEVHGTTFLKSPVVPLRKHYQKLFVCCLHSFKPVCH